jgi:hypothetical protein
LRQARRARQHKGRSKRPSSAAPRPRGNSPEISWIQLLAAPYLRGYRPTSVTRGPLRGHRFVSPRKGGSKLRAGFFVGYLAEPQNYEFLNPSPPECIVFAFLAPLGSKFHEEMVAREGSLLRKTAEYIGWLTHRPPRFAFFDDRETVLVRHFSMREWPPSKHQHYSKNFFIETLAWLVRSGLVAKFRSGSASLEGKRL